MFDTIVLVWHEATEKVQDQLELIKRENLGEPDYKHLGNAQLFYKLLNSKGKKSESSTKHFTREITGDEDMDFEEMADQSIHHTRLRDKYTAEYVQFRSKTDYKVFQKTAHIQHKVTSASYTIDMFADPQHDYIKVQLSIPKMLFGHNIAQFVPQRGSMAFYDSNASLTEWEEQKKYAHKRLFKFIQGFAKKLERDFDLSYPLDNNTLEIKRIDICYNEIYPSKEKALEGLAMKMKISKKRQSKSSNYERNIKDQTLMFTSQAGHFFKIYHKGTEVRQNDLEKWQKANTESWKEQLINNGAHQLMKYNKRLARLERILTERRLEKSDFLKSNGKDYDEELFKLFTAWKNYREFNVPFLCAEADKILRYEASMSGKFFTYYYKRECFRRSDPEYIKRKNEYIEIRKKKRKVQKEDLSSQEVTAYNYFAKFLERKVCLMYQGNKKMNYLTRQSDPILDYKHGCYEPKLYRSDSEFLGRFDQAQFTKGALGVFIDKFHEFIKHYEIKEIERDADLVTICNIANEKIQSRIEKYNYDNSLLVHDYNNDPKNEGKAKKQFAVQLLSTHQKTSLGLKKVNSSKFIGFWNEFSQGKPIDEIFQGLNLPPGAKNRMLKDLEVLGITQSTFATKEPFKNPPIGFGRYYELTSDDQYKNNFFSRPEDSQRG